MAIPNSGVSTLIASVPALLLLTPSDSVIVLALTDSGDHLSLRGPVIRYDIPPAHHFSRESAETIARVFADSPVDQLLVVITTPDGTDQQSPRDLPLRTQVSELAMLLQAQGIDSMLAVWTPEFTEGAPWRAYTADGASGVLPDPATTAAAAAVTVAGETIAADRDQLAARFTPAKSAERDRLAPLIQSASRRALADRLTPVRATERLTRATSAARAAAQGQLPVGDDDHADLIATFAVPEFRDLLLIADSDQDHLGLEDLAMHLWPLAPEPHASHLALVVAAHTYQRGNGIWARTAADAVTEPLQLRWILTKFLDAGVPPRKFADLARQAGAQTSAQLGIRPHPVTRRPPQRVRTQRPGTDRG
ncbi:DUF4192 domain-containing protein [Saccharothrix sp. AJ9571]|nr:DUF4192 domain-containing protein [Saccharothrix sp. AJ9571]